LFQVNKTASSDAVFFHVQFRFSKANPTSIPCCIGAAHTAGVADVHHQPENNKDSAMKIVFRTIAVLLFVVFFGFALKNTQEVALRFFFDYEMRGPLVLLLLAFFGAGATLGIFAMIPTVFRYRRDLNRHKKAMSTMELEQEAQRVARAQPPQPDSVVTK
jgi:lipopolysaccharide assembly protein A